jgi:asparagine synthase (glutamine-hydrolysing)
MGFDVPIDIWLRGPLREWAEALLDVKRLKDEGFLNADPVRKKWEQHVSGNRNWQYDLWGVLMFQAWLEHERSFP